MCKNMYAELNFQNIYLNISICKEYFIKYCPTAL